MDGGMAELLSPEQIKQVMLSIGQKKLEAPIETAEKVVNSLTRPKIMGTSDTEEGVLIVRRDGYKKWGNGVIEDEKWRRGEGEKERENERKKRWEMSEKKK